MKLVVLIPAFNEEKNIAKTIRSVPKQIMGIDEIKILVIDDGSTDKTTDMAINGGAYRVVSHKTNIGVGAAFMTGVRNAITMNTDIVVTVDADSQFDSNQMPELIAPIMNNQADVVIGSRFKKGRPKGIPKIKYLGNKIFTRIVSSLVQQKFTDTQTGFRAYSKKALLNISVVNDFTYTQEVLIDLKFKRMQITEVPILVKYDDTRKSRVVKNIFSYSSKVLAIITRTLVFHRPLFSFFILAGIFLGGGISAKILTMLDIFLVNASLSTGLIIMGGVTMMMGIFATVVFRRQLFAEKDLRHYIENTETPKKIGESHISH